MSHSSPRPPGPPVWCGRVADTGTKGAPSPATRSPQTLRNALSMVSGEDGGRWCCSSSLITTSLISTLSKERGRAGPKGVGWEDGGGCSVERGSESVKVEGLQDARIGIFCPLPPH
ncbi:hypothetical protein BaRGS_00007008 [Batillaria attramentaria]|uniref:Uncharacterized protein n=1 Tax=Batillaria attramentaria TaxID=370345 RepID=A0ABD0LQG9_9CAEN